MRVFSANQRHSQRSNQQTWKSSYFEAGPIAIENIKIEVAEKRSKEKKIRRKEEQDKGTYSREKKEENKMNEGASEGVSETDRNRKAAKGKFHT